MENQQTTFESFKQLLKKQHDNLYAHGVCGSKAQQDIIKVVCILLLRQKYNTFEKLETLFKAGVLK